MPSTWRGKVVTLQLMVDTTMRRWLPFGKRSRRPVVDAIDDDDTDTDTTDETESKTASKNGAGKKKTAKKGAPRPWRLVTGMHRLHGCELEGIEVIAFEVTGKPEDLADLEASENLHRRPLGPLERAKFTAALVQAAQDRIAREQSALGADGSVRH